MPPNEPLLDALDIQGNVLPGFRRRQQRLVGFQGTSEAALKAALRLVLDASLTDLSTVLGHKDDRKTAFLAGAPAPARPDLWLNYAIGVRAAEALGLERLKDLEPAFGAGMPLRAGDTTEPRLPDGSADPTCPANWVVGGPNTPLDLLLIAAADAEIEALSEPLVEQIEACGLVRIYAELGAFLPGDKEHFGFQDGISQPGVLGVIDDRGVQRFLTTRYGVPGALGIEFGKPGQPLLPPDQFLFGDEEADARNGSFLVFRRLTQDVPGFDAGTKAIADTLSRRLGKPVDENDLRARIVGRFPSGQPLMRQTAGPTVPEAALALNHFAFAGDTPDLVLSSGERIAGSQGDPLAQKGARCPIWAHIRKVNPRDMQTNLAGPDETRARQMLRRGIPFGPSYDRNNPGHPDNGRERGLLFLSYQRSISDQFEQLNGNWMNSDIGPMSGGFDLLVGQRLSDGRHGPKDAQYFDAPSKSFTAIAALEQWVMPTGGEYLFTPSISWTRRIAAVVA
ncbi:Dyp-type peroxidase [Methylobacterium sp. SyP6R]|uniref:Dyp-type peroxidase n=1 Tax=Methylobacterium sp. SyP6R TaxID=2718876 RepID=UPI001EFF633C|nr:Dyp-type peroxidase [Methylobacterium sp. SyP6R]MCF4130041.1 Dyp-type peroxidase [Methylobacterium sp. SyP6R]